MAITDPTQTQPQQDQPKADPFTAPSVDPATAESQARNMVFTSLSSYGKLPNPQVVFEAINTGAVPPVMSALSSGDPEFQSVLTSTPAGGIAGQPAPIKTISDPNTSLYQFDSNQWKAALPNLLRMDENAAWRSFGEVPILNIGWINSIQQSPDEARKWQTMLQSLGFLDKKYQASGLWDGTTKQAFQNFMIARAMPDALYGKDSNTQANARMFLQGLGLDPISLQAQLGRDPQFATQVAELWMQAQGPDQGVGTKPELQKFADKYGIDKLPQGWQPLVEGNLGDSIRNTLAAIPILGDIPVVGGLTHGIENVGTLNFDFGHLFADPRAVQEQNIESKLSEQDKQVLQPALDAAKNNSGFFGFMDNYDQARTKFILGSVYFLGDVFKGKLENPFDPLSDANMMATQHEDNLAAGLFGDGFGNSILGGITNFAANILDDPTSYIPLLGGMDKVQKFRTTRTISKALGNEEAKAIIDKFQEEGIRYSANRQFFQAARVMAKQMPPTAAGRADVYSLFGLQATGSDAVAKMKYVDKLMEEKDDWKAWDLFTNGDKQTGQIGFNYLINSNKNMYNFHAAWKALPQVKDTGIIGKMRTIGGFEEAPYHFGRTDPLALADHLKKAAYVVGLDMKELQPKLDAYLSAVKGDQNKILSSFMDVRDAITDKFLAAAQAQGLDQDTVRNMIGQHRAGRVLGKSGLAKSTDEVSTYMPLPTARSMETAVETSMGPAGRSLQRATEEAIHQKQMALATLTKGKNVPQEAIDQLNREIGDLQSGITKQRPTPALTTQLQDELHMPYSLYEMTFVLNPWLRNSEKFQSALHIDALMGVWKRVTIGRISSAFRITLGDDAIRPTVQAINMGHPLIGFRYLASAIMNSAKLLAPGLTRTGGEGEKLLLPRVTGAKGARGKVLSRIDQQISDAMEKGHDVRAMLQDAHKMFQEGDTRIFQPGLPTSVGYRDALEHVITNHFRKDPLVQTWLNAKPAERTKALKNLLQNSEDPSVQTLVNVRGATNVKQINALVKSYDQSFSAIFADPDVAEWSRTGNVNRKVLNQKIKNATMPGNKLPTIPMRVQSGFSNQVVQSWIQKGPNWIFESITKPMVDQARLEGYTMIKRLYENQIRKYHEGHPGREAGNAAWEAQIEKESHEKALNWVIQNTYQGQRSIFGGAVRNIFPFFGATANMDRFYLRQAAVTPFFGSGVAHVAKQTDKAQQDPNSGITIPGSFLAHLGFGAGEGITLNPAQAFFLTSDGIGSFIPGTGPVFAPIWNALSTNSGFASLLATIPGISNQIDYNTGQAKPAFPYLADILSGAGMALTGQPFSVPVIGESNDTLKRMVDEKIKDQEFQTGQPVSKDQIDAINREVGRDLMLQGGLSFTVPMSPRVTNTVGSDVSKQLDAWRQAAGTDPNTGQPASDAVMARALGVDVPTLQKAFAEGTIANIVAQNPQSAGAVMAYMDHRVSPEQRDAIAAAAPGVVSMATSQYQTLEGNPTDLGQWQLLRQLGDIRLLNPDELIDKIGAERDINTAWLEYDQLKQEAFDTMRANGWTQNSSQYKAWKQQTFEPKLMAIQDAHRTWAKQFNQQGSTSMAGLEEGTRSLRSLSMWEVIPQSSDYENRQSILWRNAILARDQAASQIAQIKNSHGSKAQEDAVMLGLQQNLAALAENDPNFAAQLGGFSFGRWQDVVNLEADEMNAGLMEVA